VFICGCILFTLRPWRPGGLIKNESTPINTDFDFYLCPSVSICGCILFTLRPWRLGGLIKNEKGQVSTIHLAFFLTGVLRPI
jgi:hypothetical protein